MWVLLSSLALAGYGDAIDGRPSHIEREVHFWTNLVRVQPDFFSSEYACSFNGFQASEKTPKRPLQWNHDLGEVARIHSEDMDDRNYFSHDTLGGPDFGSRVSAYYSGWFTIGENIAQGYTSAYSVVIDGWMCSSGHRASIMSGSFDELGVGVSSDYYTQDFGGANPPQRALAMGIHLPENPGAVVDFGVDWTQSSAPDEIFVVVNGDRYDLDLLNGDPNGWSGWSTRIDVGAGCHEYYFVGSAGGLTQTFPEDGSYAFGGCSVDDVEAGWIDGQLPYEEETTTPGTGDDDDDDDDTVGDDDDDDTVGDDDDDDDDDDGDDDDDDTEVNDPRDDERYDTSGGCSVLAGSSAPVGLLLLVIGLARRRR